MRPCHFRNTLFPTRLGLEHQFCRLCDTHIYLERYVYSISIPLSTSHVYSCPDNIYYSGMGEVVSLFLTSLPDHGSCCTTVTPRVQDDLAPSCGFEASTYGHQQDVHFLAEEGVPEKTKVCPHSR